MKKPRGQVPAVNLQDIKSSDRFGKIMGVSFGSIRIAWRALRNQSALNIHVHHHHWHHSRETEEGVSEIQEVHQSRDTESCPLTDPPSLLAELPGDPAHCELPAYRVLPDSPPHVKKKPSLALCNVEYAT